jgi:hypothetical protein
VRVLVASFSNTLGSDVPRAVENIVGRPEYLPRVEDNSGCRFAKT